ncbi:MAG: sigma-70 family RNA polymerase sigma factor [Actinomycetia bacterium]|nr:sigma-70 family RNA polymerase sigma factor [Actinomycetes bacterium]
MAAFDGFYRCEYRGQLQRALLFLGDLGAAEDAVHEAFLAVYRRWESIEDPGPYLNRCVLNACRDQATRGGRVQLGLPPEEAQGPESGRVELWDLLDRLVFRQRAALVLRYFEGRTETEIAQALGVRPGTVGPLITRALRHLRKELQ